MFGIVYLITNLLDGKKYVGQTTRTLEERFSEHAEAESLLGNAICKYGAENFSREVLAECETPEELDAQERFYIKELDCKHPKGYNNTDGGRRSRSPKTKVEKQLDPRKEFFLKMIGAKITYYRTLRDMSQKELAKRANMSVSSLSKIERGRYNDNVSVSLLFDIADGLQIDITMLVTFSDMEKSMWWKPLSKD
ncbi:MAG: helix-turn-helix domain-containing protein [Selenomonadaceae bacterium]|nr:helix-turn-helix domain-containing protein [Selenomonadaceae bacterium]